MRRTKSTGRESKGSQCRVCSCSAGAFTTMTLSFQKKDKENKRGERDK